MNPTLRERTFRWPAPSEVIVHAGRGEHLQWLRDMREGRVPAPPAAHAMGFEILSADEGRIVFSMRAEEWMANPMGVVHGGLITTLLDTVLTLAVLVKLPQDRVCTTIGLNVQFVRPVPATGETLAGEGGAVHVGKTIGTAEGRVLDARGRLIAHGTATMAIMPAGA
jgi:uncharacterized protein (TIGR00369 family)